MGIYKILLALILICVQSCDKKTDALSKVDILQKPDSPEVISHYSFPRIDNFTQNVNPGVAVLVIKNGRTILKKGYGFANLDKKITINENTTFELASISKMFTAAAILQLSESGKIDLKLPAKNYLPPELEFISDNITVENLIFHTSGLPDYLNDNSLNLDKLVNSGKYYQNSDVIDYIKKRNLGKNVIGKTFSYSNTNYVLLSLIISHVSKMSYVDYMQKNILRPIGIDADINELGRSPKEHDSVSYSDWPYFMTLKNKHNYLTTGDFGIQMSMNDFEKWINYLLYKNRFLWKKYNERGYRVISPVMYKINSMPFAGDIRDFLKIKKDKMIGTADTDYGYGMRFGYIGDFYCTFHRGYLNGASNIFAYNKTLNTFVLILSNTSSTFTDKLAVYIFETIATENAKILGDK